MRLSNLAITFAIVALPAYAAGELATMDAVTTNGELLAKEEAVESEITAIEGEIKTLEAELGTYETTTDSTATRTIDDGSTETTTDAPAETTTEPTDTTDDKTLTTDPCPLRATVECDVGMVMIEDENPENPNCPDYKCVPNLCADTEDLSLSFDATSCERYLDGDCYRYKCATVDPPPPTYCSLNPETDSTCQGDYIKTGVGEDGCILVECYVPCTPTCSGGTKALISDKFTCDYECVKKGGKTTGGGDDGTDGGGGKTKVCKGRNCRRKNLRA